MHVLYTNSHLHDSFAGQQAPTAMNYPIPAAHDAHLRRPDGRSTGVSGVASIRVHGFAWDFGPVAADEIAFAMALFVAAASRRVLPKRLIATEIELSERREAGRVFLNLVPSRPVPFLRSSESEGSTLGEAFLAVWQHYAGDERQASICARVLGFHLLMERTEGEAVGHWLVQSPDDPGTVLLHPAVVDAIAAVPLMPEGRFPEDLFRIFLTRQTQERGLGTSEGAE